MNVYKKSVSANDLWNIVGDFGEFDASVTTDGATFHAENSRLEVQSETVVNENGVCVRKGRVKNISDEEVVLYALSSRFTFDGGEYEVYSQSNCWQNESEGCWQPLVTAVSAYSKSIRNASGAAPFMVLWSDQQNRGTAFHLKAYSAWEMRISRQILSGEVTFVEVELGVLKDGFALRLKAGEEVDLPEIIFYEVRNKTDLDCWKLHSYLNNVYPRKTLPVIYNTWLYKFDRFTYEDIKKQIEKAKELGVEYFVIDAGWFGDGENWWPSRGDWKENLNFGFRGRMEEIAQEVRNAGMRFGFWIEPECASEGSAAVQENPEYFLKGKKSYFIDFANPNAKNYILEKTCKLIDQFGAEFVKFDFNADLYFDYSHTGFMEYFQGHLDYIKKLKARYPALYLEDCASGGMRLTVRDGEFYDGFWPTDDQSPYDSLRIFKDTILRMPPQWLEGWVSVRSAEKFSYNLGTDEMAEKLFATHDATWSKIVSLDLDYLFGFMKGRAIALSFDLTSLSETAFEQLKHYITEFKNQRDFWKTAVCHILTDTPTMLVLEFRSEDCSKIELVAFSGKRKQNNLCVYPVIDAAADYAINGEAVRTGISVAENGIDIPIAAAHTAQVVRLDKVMKEKP